MSKNGSCCCAFLRLLLTIMIVLGLAMFIFWLIFRPQRIKVDVNDVTLSEFNLTENNIVHYNLTMNITVRNPNKKMGIYYDRIEANAYYKLQRLDTVMLTPFYQGHKNTSYLTPVFAGQRLVVLGTKELAEFKKEKDSGVYSIPVLINLKVRFKFGIMKVRWLILPVIACDLKVPLAGANGTSAGDTKAICKSITF